MVFIIAYRLKRKNARRKIAAKIFSCDANHAIEHFKKYAEANDDSKKSWELLTGDWKTITHYEGKEKG